MNNRAHIPIVNDATNQKSETVNASKIKTTVNPPIPPDIIFKSFFILIFYPITIFDYYF